LVKVDDTVGGRRGNGFGAIAPFQVGTERELITSVRDRGRAGISVEVGFSEDLASGGRDSVVAVPQ
jgi:hypothetical protein